MAMNREEFVRGIAPIIGAVGKPMPDEMITAWRTALFDLTPQQLERGVGRTLRTYQFAGFPPVAIVLGNALGKIAATDVERRGIAAWDRVMTAIRRHGSYRSVNFDDPIINATIRSIGGWKSITEETSEALSKMVQPRFVKTYAALYENGISETESGPLHGIVETENVKLGYEANTSTIEVVTGLPQSGVKVIPAAVPKRLPSSVEAAKVADAFSVPNDQ